MIKYVEGDLLEALASSPADSYFVPHVCNNRGVYGAGFAAALHRKYPAPRNAYLDWYAHKTHERAGLFGLGKTQFVLCQRELHVVACNMVAQDGVRRDYTDKGRFLRYDALVDCLRAVAVEARHRDARIWCPLFGAGLAGGNWEFINELITDCWGGLDVSVFYLPGQGPHWLIA